MLANDQAAVPHLVSFASATDAGKGQVEPLLKAKLEALVGVPWQQCARSPSALNNDGSPLELCLSASATGVKRRLIGDPHLGLAMGERVPASLANARHLMRLTGSTAMAGAFILLSAHTIPPDPARREALPNGALWLACSMDGDPGFAAYTNIEWCGGRKERWQRALVWLRQACSGFDDAALTHWRQYWTPFAAALEGDRPERAHAKLYFRLAPGTYFGPAALGQFDDAVVDAFCRGVIQGRTLPGSGIVLSTEFALQTGRLTGIKLDICGHCTPRTPAEWQGLAVHLAHTADLPLLPLDKPGPMPGVAFIGIGRRAERDYRLNLYLKHPREFL